MSEVDTWSIVEPSFEVASNRHFESLMTIGSGSVQQRGSLEEGLRSDPQDVAYPYPPGRMGRVPESKSRVGTFMPGISAAHPTHGDQMVNLPAIHGLKTYVADERLHMESERVSDYRRWLNLRSGHLNREFTWQTHLGSRLRFHFERFVSANRRHVMALRCTIEHLDGPPAELRFLVPLDAEVFTNGFDHFERIDITGEHEPITLAVRLNSGIDVAAAALVTCDRGLPWSVEVQPRWVSLCGACTLDQGETLTIDKFAALTSSRHATGPPVDVARKLAWEAAAAGFTRVAAESDAVWRERWDKTDVLIEGDPESQLGLRAGLYHLLRAAVGDDPRAAIDATAATCEELGGRYRWESDIFMLPMFLYTRPEVGKTLARFRAASLDGARQNAMCYGYPGARYAWDGAPNGFENALSWQHADHAVHVTADVAYGVFHAHLVCPADARFLCDACETLIEIARYWSARATYTAEDDTYEVLMTMGPDEYAPFSRNNAYTNRLAAFALTLAGFMWDKLRRADANAADELREKLELRADEFERFVEVASKLRLPYDEAHKLVLQSDDFFRGEAFDWERWWPDRSRPLCMTVSQERLYRSRAIQQADVLLLMALFPHEFDDEQVRTAYEVYEPQTSHDGSLSKAVHAIVAARIGKVDEALRMWLDSVGLGRRPGPTSQGVDAGRAGANWMAAVQGFGGVRTRMQSEVLHIDPHLPPTWSALRFPLVWDGQPLYVSIEHGRVEIEHRGACKLSVTIFGRTCELSPGDTSVIAAESA